MPHKGIRVLIVAIDVLPYGLLQMREAGVDAALDPLLPDLAEKALDQIEPGREGGREVNVIARVGC